jgi:hypothetical protein
MSLEFGGDFDRMLTVESGYFEEEPERLCEQCQSRMGDNNPNRLCSACIDDEETES